MPDPIRIEGLREFQAALRAVDKGLPKHLRMVLNDAAQLVVKGAQALVPKRSGRAAASIRAASSQREGRVRAGGGKAPYYPWLDWGGRVGRRNSVSRPFIREGRYIYPTYKSQKGAVEDALADGLIKLARSSGLDVK